MENEFPEQASVEIPTTNGKKKFAYVVHVENLSDLGDFVDGIEPLLTTLNGYVDGLEALATTINSNVDQLETISTGISTLVATPGNIGDGVKNVAAAETRERLVADVTVCREVVITAKETNTGTIVVGGASVVALAGATRRGVPLNARESVTIKINDLNKIFIDATVSGEGVTFAYVY